MKLFLLLMAAAIGALPAFAQVSLSADGTVSVKPAGKDTRNFPIELSNIPPALTSATLTDKQKDAFKKAMGQKIALAYDNIRDSSLGTIDLYTFLWGNDGYGKLVNDLAVLNNYFFPDPTRRPVQAQRSPTLPVPSDFDTMLGTTIFDVKDTTFPNQRVIRIYQTDPFEKWLIKRYNADYLTYIATRDSLFSRMSIDYKAGWRQLEAIYTKALNEVATIRKFQGDAQIICRSEKDFIDSLTNVINGNIIVKGLRENVFMRRWLWFTNGQLTINPLAATTDDKRYPAGEPFRFRDTTKDAKTSPVTLEQVQTARKLFNRVILPYSDKKQKQPMVIHYNFQEAVKIRNALILDSLPKNIVQGRPVVICTYNVPKDVVVKYTYTTTALPASKVLQQLTSGADGLNVLLSVLSPLTAFWTANVAPLAAQSNTLPGTSTINPPPPPPGPPKAGAAPDTRGSILQQRIPCTCERDNLIGDFIKADCIKLPASTDHEYEKAVEYLISRYRKFEQEAAQKWADQLASGIMDAPAIKALQALLRITDRSLPPDTLSIKTDEDHPVYRTETYVPPLSGLVQTNYTLNTVTTTKDGKDNAEQVLSGAIKVYRKSLFKFSVGFGWTFADYNRNLVTTAGNQVSVTNDNAKARLVAGLNIYPWYLLEPDDKFVGVSKMPWRHRVSVFFGVGIPTPLQNYYGGIGVDLIPGIKIQGGVHGIHYKKSQVSNNIIISQADGFEFAGVFASLNLDVSFVAKLIGVSK